MLELKQRTKLNTLVVLALILMHAQIEKRLLIIF